METNTPPTKKLLHVSVAALCLSVSALAIVTLVEVRRISAMTVDYISDARQRQKEMEAKAQDATDIVSEAMIYASATLLEQNRANSRTDAEKLKSEAIDHISKKSERWGKIVKAVNDASEHGR
jgi:hypothetical protein